MSEIDPRGALVRATQLALASQGATLMVAADVFAAACIDAALRHPEWALAVVRTYDDDEIAQMADALVAASAFAFTDEAANLH